jgi:hypothetical protein
MDESLVGFSPSSHSVFCSSPFANLTEIADAPSDATWSDMPPLVLPPTNPLDTSLVTKHAPSLDFNTFVFHEAPATCIESIDPLSPAPNIEMYAAFHAETPSVSCAPESFSSPLAIDMSFLETWSPSPFSSSPCTPVSYSAGPFSSVEAAPAPAFDPYNMVNQFDSCGAVGFDRSQETAPPAGLRSDPLVHVPHPVDQHCYPASKGPFQFFNHKFPVPEVANMDVTGFTDMFVATAQNFGF